MKPVFFLLPFLKSLFIYRSNVHNHPAIIVDKKNISMFENFNTLPIPIQLFILNI